MATKVPAAGHGFRTAASTESMGPNNGIAESADQGCNTAVANSSSCRSSASPKTARETPPIGMDDTSAGVTFKDEQSDPLRSPSESSDSLLLTAVCHPSIIGPPSSVKSMSTAFTEASYANLRTEEEASAEFVEPTDSSSIEYLSPGRYTAASSSQSPKPSEWSVKLRPVSGKEQKSSAKASSSATDEAFAFSPRCYTNSSSVPNESPKTLVEDSRGAKQTPSASSLSSERDTTKDFNAFSPKCFLSSTKENAVRSNSSTKLESLDRPSRAITPTSDASPLRINISVVAQSCADPTWQRCDYIVIPPKQVTFNGHLYERMD